MNRQKPSEPQIFKENSQLHTTPTLWANNLDRHPGTWTYPAATAASSEQKSHFLLGARAVVAGARSPVSYQFSIGRGGRPRPYETNTFERHPGTWTYPAATAASSEEKPRFFLGARPLVTRSPMGSFHTSMDHSHEIGRCAKCDPHLTRNPMGRSTYIWRGPCNPESFQRPPWTGGPARNRSTGVSPAVQATAHLPSQPLAQSKLESHRVRC
jgi:hypothetical protein